MLKKLSFLIWTVFTASILPAVAVNEPAPLFPYVNTNGENRTSADFKGKIMLVNFWASWCAPCQEELPELNQLAFDYKEKKFLLIAINLDKDSAQARKILKKIGLNKLQMSVLWDPESKSASAFNPDAMPSSFIINAQGIIRFIHTGYHKQDPEIWRKEVDGLLGEPDAK